MYDLNSDSDVGRDDSEITASDAGALPYFLIIFTAIDARRESCTCTHQYNVLWQLRPLEAAHAHPATVFPGASSTSHARML